MCGLFKAVVVVLLNFALTTALAQESLTTSIKEAIEMAKADAFSAYLNTYVKFEYFGEENVLSSRQFIAVLSDFFQKNPPLAFSVDEVNEGEQFSYYTGYYRSQNMIFKFTFLLTKKSGVQKIYQLKIEKMR